MALLELREVSAAYGAIQILHGVSLHVNPGEVVSVIGPGLGAVSRKISSCPGA